MSPFAERLKNNWIKFWGIVFFIGVVINFTEIISRTFFNYSVDLMYDFPVWFTVWSVMMVAGPILPDGDHVSVDMIQMHLKGKARKITDLINATACIIFSTIITWGGYLYIKQTIEFKMNFIRAISIPRWTIEICVPLGMLIFTIFAIYNFIKICRTNYSDDNATQVSEYI